MHPASLSTDGTTYAQRRHARRVAAEAIRDGLLVRGGCADASDGDPCSIGTVHGHHEDYRLPLEVVWLCGRHHARRHHDPSRDPAGPPVGPRPDDWPDPLDDEAIAILAPLLHLPQAPRVRPERAPDVLPSEADLAVLTALWRR